MQSLWYQNTFQTYRDNNKANMHSTGKCNKISNIAFLMNIIDIQPRDKQREVIYFNVVLLNATKFIHKFIYRWENCVNMIYKSVNTMLINDKILLTCFYQWAKCVYMILSKLCDKTLSTHFDQWQNTVNIFLSVTKLCYHDFISGLTPLTPFKRW